MLILLYVVLLGWTGFFSLKTLKIVLLTWEPCFKHRLVIIGFTVADACKNGFHDLLDFLVLSTVIVIGLKILNNYYEGAF